MSRIDPESLERLQQMSPEQRFETVRTLCYQAPGGGGSDHYVELMEEMVALGILSWDEIEAFEARG
jgi:hypothetical protein